MPVRIKYYRVRNGNGFWEPNATMRSLGFDYLACGVDGPAAWLAAEERNKEWQAYRKKNGLLGRPGLSSDAGYVYFLRLADRVKIGFSKNPFCRSGAMKTAFDVPITSLVAVAGTRRDEKLLQLHFAPLKARGEWFRCSAELWRTAMRCASIGSVELPPKSSKPERLSEYPETALSECLKEAVQ